MQQQNLCDYIPDKSIGKDKFTCHPMQNYILLTYKLNYNCIDHWNATSFVCLLSNGNIEYNK